jgi:hypothetical protein
MPKFKVTEVVVYLVDADDEDHAEDIITNAEDRDQYCIEVSDRYAEEADDGE